MSASLTALRFSYRGWDVRISLRGTPEQGEVQAEAELVDASTRHHSLLLVGRHVRGATALGALALQARDFINRRPRYC